MIPKLKQLIAELRREEQMNAADGEEPSEWDHGYATGKSVAAAMLEQLLKDENAN